MSRSGERELGLGDFKIGPMTAMELLQTMKVWLQDLLKNQSLKELFVDIKAGKTSAIATVVVTIGLGVWLLYLIWLTIFGEAEKAHVDAPKKDPVVLRDFTVEQLREFDGKNGKPIFIGLDGDVFDVSSAPEFYGEGAAYNCFAGRNATRAMAKFSFEEEDLSNNDLSDLGPFEKNTLDDWVQKFKYFRPYPVVGKYSFPPKGLELTVEDLRAFDGTQTPDSKRLHAPVYVALKENIYDVSYGGFELYGPRGPYDRFAGKDASRALAKMSFDESDINSSNLADLTPREMKVLQEWIDKFLNAKKYPIVGNLMK